MNGDPCRNAGRCHGYSVAFCSGCGVVAPCARADCPSCAEYPETLEEARKWRRLKRRWCESEASLKQRYGRTWKRRLARARRSTNECRAVGMNGCIFSDGNTTPSRKIEAPWLRDRDMRPCPPTMFPELPVRGPRTRMSTYETRDVLAGAYEGGARKKHFGEKAWLSHTVEFDDDGKDVRVLCGRVKLENMADAGASTAEELASRPTCKHCEKKDPRWKKETSHESIAAV